MTGGHVGVTVTLTDGDGDKATSATADVSGQFTFHDDGPTFTHIDNAIVANQDNNVVVGTHNLTFGADGEKSIEITPLTNISGVTYLPVVHNLDGSTDLIAQVSGSNFFDLKVSADGTYTFTLIESRPVSSQDFDFNGVAGSQGTSQFILGDATFKAVDTDHNNSIGGGEILKPTSSGFGVGNGNLDPGEQFQINFASSVDSMKFLVNHQANGAFTMTYTTDTGLTGTVSSSTDGWLTVNPTGDFSSITFTVTAGKAKFDDFGYSKLILPSDQTFHFGVSGVDGDGDHSSTQTLSVTTLGEHPAGTPIAGTAGDDAIAGTSGNETISGLAGNDTLYGGGGDDILIGGTGLNHLIGGAGNDTFVIDASKLTVHMVDVIADYTPGHDVIDLSDLLQSLGGNAPTTDAQAGAAVNVTFSNNAAHVMVDDNGTAAGGNMVEVASLTGVGVNSAITILYDHTHTHTENVT